MRKILGLVCLAFSACKPSPELCPHVRYPDEARPAEYWLSSPIVVVGTFGPMRIVGRPAQIVRGEPSSEVQAVESEVAIEAVLKGDIAVGPVTISHFMALDPAGMFRREPFPRSGERRILFLHREGRRIRFLLDFPNKMLSVHSGIHASNMYRDETIDRKILYTLLTPGDGFNPHIFAEYLESDVGRAHFPDSLKYTADLLRGLLKNPDDNVKDRACIVLAGSYYGQEGCLLGIQPNGEPGHDKWVAFLIEKAKHREPDLIKRLESDPLSFGDLSLESAAQGLEILSMHPNKRIQSLACVSLRRCFPRRSVKECAVSAPRPFQP